MTGTRPSRIEAHTVVAHVESDVAPFTVERDHDRVVLAGVLTATETANSRPRGRLECTA